jgi:hypothetical protein
MVEIGYWRKAYDQEDAIYSIVVGKFNEQNNLLITKEEVENILTKANSILKTHEFDPYTGEDLSEGCTWQSKRKWEDTIRFFTEAKQILEEDPKAEIYYHRWD